MWTYCSTMFCILNRSNVEAYNKGNYVIAIYRMHETIILTLRGLNRYFSNKKKLTKEVLNLGWHCNFGS